MPGERRWSTSPSHLAINGSWRSRMAPHLLVDESSDTLAACSSSPAPLASVTSRSRSPRAHFAASRSMQSRRDRARSVGCRAPPCSPVPRSRLRRAARRRSSPTSRPPRSRSMLALSTRRTEISAETMVARIRTTCRCRTAPRRRAAATSDRSELREPGECALRLIAGVVSRHAAEALRCVPGTLEAALRLKVFDDQLELALIER